MGYIDGDSFAVLVLVRRMTQMLMSVYDCVCVCMG